MAANINRVTISGNLVKDAEFRTTAGGTEVAIMRIASNERRRNPQTGEWADHANFFRVVKYGKTPEWLKSELVKGAKATFDGHLRYASWEKDGRMDSLVEIVAENVEPAGKRPAKADQADVVPAGVEDFMLSDEDIPF